MFVVIAVLVLLVAAGVFLMVPSISLHWGGNRRVCKNTVQKHSNVKPLATHDEAEFIKNGGRSAPPTFGG